MFVSNRTGSSEIFKVPAGGGEAVQLTKLGRWADCPKFSPDGSKIAHISNESGNNDVWIMDADGNNRQQVTTHQGSDNYVAWLPDGRSLLWSSDRDQDDADIWRLDISSGEKTQLTTAYGADFSPAPSPNGEMIAFVSNRPLDPQAKDLLKDRDKDIWLMTIDGDLQLRLTSNQGADFAPCWSPDGKYLLYASSSDRSAGHLRCIDLTQIEQAYHSGDVERIADVAMKIRTEKLEMGREPLKQEIGAQRRKSLFTFFLPDNWVKPFYPVEFFGSERYPDWVAS